MNREILDQVIEISVAAGKEILDVYENDFEVEIKGDGSPLTMADQRAHQVIVKGLESLTPEIPVLSEESSSKVMEMRQDWARFWLVDPLDGTKEFVKRNGEFTVNIALIDGRTPVMGVVHTPVKSVTHAGHVGQGAFKIDSNGERFAIAGRKFDANNAVMVASRSHAGEAVQRFHQRLEKVTENLEIASMGSSLKICMVAEGTADVYPRLGPTSEWDTAAAHAVLKAAGGQIFDLQGESLRYNKQNILNPWFVAVADDQVNWLEFAEGLSPES